MLISTSMFKAREVHLLGLYSMGYRRPDSLTAFDICWTS